MNLIIDIGNTRTKFTVINDDKLIFSSSDNSFNIDGVKKIATKHPEIKNCILSSSGHFPKEANNILTEIFDLFIEFNYLTPNPVKLSYTSPQTLGLDRLAGVCGAHTLYPHKNVMIIDAGTAITYDIKDKDGVFAGGNISPGLNMRFLALHNFTAKLPLIKPSDTISLFGINTNMAILNGVVNGILFEIEGYIEVCSKNYEDLTIIITGGDAQFFDNKLKKTIFVHQNLVSTGLNSILNYNVANN